MFDDVKILLTVPPLPICTFTPYFWLTKKKPKPGWDSLKAANQSVENKYQTKEGKK